MSDTGDMELDPFVKAKQMMNAGREKVRAMLDSVLSKKVTEKDIFDEQIAELKADVAEVELYFKDSRYIRAKRFMDGLREGLSRSLERMAANCSDTLEIARLGAKIEILDQIRNRPGQLVKELERINKSIKEK